MNEFVKTCGKYVAGAVAAVAPPVLFFWLLECYTHNPFDEVRPWAHLFNILLFEFVAGILFCLTGRLKAAYRIEAAGAMIFGIANAYVVRFRTNPLVPWDLFSWRTAANVMGNYDFTPDARITVVTLLFLASMALLHFVRIRPWRLVYGKRFMIGGLLVLLLICFADMLQQESFQNRHQLYNKLFTPVYMTNVDGIAVTFVMNLAYMSIEKPEGYSIEEARELLAEYQEPEEGAGASVQPGSGDAAVPGQEDSAAQTGSDCAAVPRQEDSAMQTGSDGAAVPGQEDPDGQELPNLIVVMNESFADLSVLGEFETNRDCLPYLHGLQAGADNTVTGTLHVSVCGGNTANTEFEFLTGNTMAFLPQGSVPYQQYLTGPRASLASWLLELGYETVATHPYYANGWERDTVYPWLGFSESLFLDAYESAPRVRGYVSDTGCVDQIIRLYENKPEGKPLFVFNVTMQNHGGYQDLYANFTPDIEVSGIENVSLLQYLSLTELSDRSLKYLIDYFSLQNEKTVVVFFGDHQPGDVVAAPILAQNGMRWNALTDEQLPLRYQVPYVIWANYDIGEAQNVDTSVNYLAAEVCERAGIPLSVYQRFLLELKKVLPVFTAVYRETAEGVSAQQEKEALNRYQKLQYYYIFD